MTTLFFLFFLYYFSNKHVFFDIYKRGQNNVCGRPPFFFRSLFSVCIGAPVSAQQKASAQALVLSQQFAIAECTIGERRGSDKRGQTNLRHGPNSSSHTREMREGMRSKKTRNCLRLFLVALAIFLGKLFSFLILLSRKKKEKACRARFSRADRPARRASGAVRRVHCLLVGVDLNTHTQQPKAMSAKGIEDIATGNQYKNVTRQSKGRILSSSWARQAAKSINSPRFTKSHTSSTR